MHSMKKLITPFKVVSQQIETNKDLSETVRRHSIQITQRLNSTGHEIQLTNIFIKFNLCVQNRIMVIFQRLVLIKEL